MSNHDDRIEELNQKLEELLGKQERFAKELMSLYQEIESFKKQPKKENTGNETLALPLVEPTKSTTETIKPTKITLQDEATKTIEAKPPQLKRPPKIKIPKDKSNWEKFIGENLINKIGVAITVIGVAIGAKYSIENDLISPLTRIVLGYLVGLGLLAFGIKLKAKYENYSAVLVGGALAIVYFITYAAYSFYGLFPQLIAFAAMVVFTVFGVVAALNYNKQVIAHIGLVGAYAVPFLLSNNSGNAAVLFSYMAIINIGILAISVKQYWKALFYSSFVFTWLIYGSWAALSFEREEHFTLALIFITVFFLIFYVTFLAYKLIKSEKFLMSDVVLLLLNSFIFYGLGYGLLAYHETGKELLGVFTVCNAIVHFIVSAILFKKKLADNNLFHLISGLVLVFITIAIPVQLDGNWVTLLWAFEAALLFWIGRSKKISFYEHLAYPLMILGFLSLTHDWGNGYGSFFSDESQMKPILNSYFLTSILFLAAFAFINWINLKRKASTGRKSSSTLTTIMSFGIPALFLFVLYAAFYLEIEHYWQIQFNASKIELSGGDDFNYPKYNYDLKNFGNVWLFNYTLLFLSVLAFVNIKKLKNRLLGIITLVAAIAVLLLFLSGGLYLLSELRTSYLDRDLSEYYVIGFFNIVIRYVAFAFLAFFLYAVYALTKRDFMKINVKVPFELLLHLTILWILSSELLNWMDIAGSDQTYKLGLSIFWGVYALFLVSLGIWKQKKYLRVSAIILFGITLIKLFFYDIVSLSTISKTIVFVSLGLLLLIISFLYNKYKNTLYDDKKAVGNDSNGANDDA